MPPHGRQRGGYFSARRRILPTFVLGISLRNSTSFGIL
jgi:hypothetical protein